MTRCGVSTDSALVSSAALRIAVAMSAYCFRCSEFHCAAGVVGSRLSQPCDAIAANALITGAQSAQVGSLVMISIGPSSPALATSAASGIGPGGGPAECRPCSGSLRVTKNVTATVTTTTTNSASPPKTHLVARAVRGEFAGGGPQGGPVGGGGICPGGVLTCTTHELASSHPPKSLPGQSRQRPRLNQRKRPRALTGAPNADAVFNGAATKLLLNVIRVRALAHR